MNKKVLVAFATRCGSTEGVANKIGDVLNEKGFNAEVLPARQVRGVEGYNAVVMGSCVRMGRIMPEMKRFMRRNAAAIGRLPAACFTVCLALKDDTAEKRQEAQNYLRPFTAAFNPVAAAPFAGAFDMAKMNPFFRWVFSKDKTGAFKTSDYRDWAAIGSWAEALAGKLA